MDWRIEFLKFFNDRSFWLNLAWTVLFLSLGALAVGLEYRRNKGLYTWMLVSMIRIAARMLFGDNIEHACSLHSADAEGCNSLRCCRRSASAICDFYGFIWFLAGVDLLYTENDGLGDSPLTFTVTIVLLTASLLYYLIPFLLHYSLMRSPPLDPRDRLFLFRIQHETQAPLLEESSQEQRARWRQWLGDRGCHEHPFGWEDICHRASIDDKAGDIENSTSADPAMGIQDKLLKTNSRNSTEWSCSICLQSFKAGKKNDDSGRAESKESNDSNHDIEHGIVVAFPCKPRHIFHVSCLHHWLQVCRGRGDSDRNLTCPCCRQPAFTG